jgi:hypothetical protein
LAFGQNPANTQSNYNPPKTAWGDPDLQGVYTTDDLNGVPMERPAKYGTRRFLTEQEFAERAKDVNSEKSTIDTGIRPTTGFWSRVKDAGVDAAAAPAQWIEYAKHASRLTAKSAAPHSPSITICGRPPGKI